MEEHVFGVPTNLVHEQDVGQVDLFKVEELLGIKLSGYLLYWQLKWGGVEKPPGLDNKISVLDVGT